MPGSAPCSSGAASPSPWRRVRAHVPVNRWLLARGKGHTAVHETGIHGGPPTRVVGAVRGRGFIFGTTVLIAEAVSGEAAATGHERRPVAAAGPARRRHAEPTPARAGPVRGREWPRARGSTTRAPAGPGDRAQLPGHRRRRRGGDRVRRRAHERMHLIVVRRDMTGFQHLHPKLARDGTWSTPVTLPEAGAIASLPTSPRWRGETLGADLAVDGRARLPAAAAPAGRGGTDGGYEVGARRRDIGCGRGVRARVRCHARRRAGRGRALSRSRRPSGRPARGRPGLPARASDRGPAGNSDEPATAIRFASGPSSRARATTASSSSSRIGAVSTPRR